MSEDYKGYRNPALQVLKENQVKVWSRVKMQTSRGLFSGLILPRSETSDPRHIVLKLKNGYNIGIATDTIKTIKEIDRKIAEYKIPEKEFPFDDKKPNVKLLGTGGTIASRLDYRTGAVIPAFSPGELYGSVPGTRHRLLQPLLVPVDEGDVVPKPLDDRDDYVRPQH